MTTPLGYINNPIGHNSRDLQSLRVSDKAISTVKAALQNYINSFLDPKGANRPLAESILSPQAVQFVTTLTYDDEMKTDPNQRKLYLSRFFAENAGKLPAILLIDAGVEYIDQGINDLVGAGFRNGRWEGHFLLNMKITLSTVIATLSAEDTDTLSSFMMLAYGPLANASCNYLLKEPGQSWEVRLPLIMSPGQATSTQVENDSKTTIWSRNVDLVCDFESIVSISQADKSMVLPIEPTYGRTDQPLPIVKNLIANQSIQLGSPYQLIIEQLQTSHTLAISDPNIALVSMDQPYLIYPRRQGRVMLYIFDKRLDEQVTGLTHNGRLIAEIPFRVTA